MRRSPHVALALVVLAAFGCATGEAPPDARPQPASRPATERVESPPEWRPGDRWTYEWTSGKESGTKAIEVMDAREVNGVRYYVTRLAEVEHFYTRDLHWAAAVRDGRVEARIVPPQPWFRWPLEVGARWTFHGDFESTSGRASHDDTFTVAGTDVVEVPAGRFPALRVIRQAGGPDSDEYWYAPAVRWYARWVGRRGDATFEERLREYLPAPRTAREAPPSGTR